MLPKTIFKKNDRKAATAACGRYSIMDIKHILIAFMLEILIFEVCTLFALEQINLVQFFSYSRGYVFAYFARVDSVLP